MKAGEKSLRNSLPRFLSAARASFHTLVSAALPPGAPNVPSGEQLYQLVHGVEHDQNLLRGMWAILAALIHIRLHDWGKYLSVGISPSPLPMIPSPAMCRWQLEQWGYPRPHLFGWHSGSVGAETLEVFFAVGWIAASCDAFSIARELAWSKRPSHLLPPWPADTGRARAAEDEETSRPPNPTNTTATVYDNLGDASNALLLRFGRLRHSMRQLGNLEAMRVKQLERIADEQYRQASECATDNATPQHAAAPPRGRNKPATKHVGGDQSLVLSAYELHIFASGGAMSAHVKALERSCDLVERLKASQDLEAPFWHWLAQALAAADARQDKRQRQLDYEGDEDDHRSGVCDGVSVGEDNRNEAAATQHRRAVARAGNLVWRLVQQQQQQQEAPPALSQAAGGASSTSKVRPPQGKEREEVGAEEGINGDATGISAAGVYEVAWRECCAHMEDVDLAAQTVLQLKDMEGNKPSKRSAGGDNQGNDHVGSSSSSNSNSNSHSDGEQKMSQRRTDVNNYEDAMRAISRVKEEVDRDIVRTTADIKLSPKLRSKLFGVLVDTPTSNQQLLSQLLLSSSSSSSSSSGTMAGLGHQKGVIAVSDGSKKDNWSGSDLECLEKAVHGRSRLAHNHRSVLQGSLALVETHFPPGTTTVRFATVRQRQRQAALTSTLSSRPGSNSFSNSN